jgi:hypothetical protein
MPNTMGKLLERELEELRREASMLQMGVLKKNRNLCPSNKTRQRFNQFGKIVV